MPVELVQDFAWVGILLLIGYFLRSKIRLFQKLFIPASVLGGLVGLLLSKQVLGRFCPFSIDLTPNIGSLATVFLAIVFTTQFLGTKLNKGMAKHSATVFFLNSGIYSLQILVGLAVVLFLMKSNPKVPFGMGMLPFTGWCGGHGMGAAVAPVLETEGVLDANNLISLSNTFATIGMLFGVIFGIIVINICARKGLISSMAGLDSLSADEAKGFVPVKDRRGIVKNVTTNDVMNPIAFHLAIIFAIMFFAYLLLGQIQKIPFFAQANILMTALVVSLIAGFITRRPSVSKYIEPESLNSISGSALEFLIASSVATTNLDIIVSFGKEMVILNVVIAIVTVAYVLVLGRLWHKKHWVEHSLATFGMATGVVATGFLLVRVADPEGKTGAAANFALGNIFSTLLVDMPLLIAFPPIMLASRSAGLGIPAAVCLACTIGGFIFAGITRNVADE